MYLKGLAVDTPIPTPGCLSTMAALAVGDEVTARLPAESLWAV